MCHASQTHSRLQGPSRSLFQLKKLRPGESATRTIYSRPVGSGVSLASHSPCIDPLCPPNMKLSLFCVHYFSLVTLLFGQRHKTQPLRFYRMRQGQRCGEGTRDAQEGTVSVSSPTSLIRSIPSGDVWHRTQLLTILQDVCASIPTQIPNGIEKCLHKLTKLLVGWEVSLPLAGGYCVPVKLWIGFSAQDKPA